MSGVGTIYCNEHNEPGRETPFWINASTDQARGEGDMVSPNTTGMQAWRDSRAKSCRAYPVLGIVAPCCVPLESFA